MKTALIATTLMLATAGAQIVESVAVGDFLWMGRYYKNATARLEGADFVRIGGVKIPWEKAPANVKKGLTEAREERRKIEVEMAARKADSAWREKSGIEYVTGKVIGPTPDGVLLMWHNGKIVHLRTKRRFADGSEPRLYGKPNGLYEYTTTLGAASRVANYLEAPEKPGAVVK